MGRRGIQIVMGVVALAVWGAAGALSLPASRLNGLANFPNPFDSRLTATTIVYRLESDARTSVQVLDLFGTPVRTWDFSPGEPGAAAGENRVVWDGTDESGRKVAAGGYICRVWAEEPEGFVSGTRKVGVIH